MEVVGGIFLGALLIGMGCLVWYKRGRKIQAEARKIANIATSDIKSVETKTQAIVDAADQTIRKM